METPVERVKVADLTLEQKRYLTSPRGFVKHILKLPLYDDPNRQQVGTCSRGDSHYYDIFRGDTQARVLAAIEPEGSRVSVKTCNGAGKTSTIVAGSILWHLAMFPHSLVVSTAGVHRQVKDQLWPALEMHAHKFEGWNFKRGNLEIVAPNGSRYLGFVTDDAGKAEGYHGNKNPLYDLKHDKGPLMIIIDEAKSVPDGIFGAVDRCTYQRLLYTSSCGFPEGEFYRSHTVNAGLFKTFSIDAGECPHLDHDKNAEVILKRGVDHPLVLSTIFARFMANADGAIVPLEVLEACLRNDTAKQGYGRAAFCDFAAGGDENVLAVAEGNEAKLVKCWREKNTMAAVGQFIVEFRKLGLAPNEIYGDNDGLGKPMVDALHEAGWPINRESNGREAHDSYSYFNRGAEIWYEGAESIRKCEVILPDDEELKAQLTGRKGKPNSKGKLQVESKDEMKRAGRASPDRADAILGAMACQKMTPGRAPAERDFDGFFEGMAAGAEIEIEENLGIYAG